MTGKNLVKETNDEMSVDIETDPENEKTKSMESEKDVGKGEPGDGPKGMLEVNMSVKESEEILNEQPKEVQLSILTEKCENVI